MFSDVKQAVKWQVFRHVTGYNMNMYNNNKCVRLPEPGEVLDCDCQFTILSPISFDRPSSDAL